MKKHLSVLFLAVRSTLCPVLVVLGLMVLCETLAFRLVLRGAGDSSLPALWSASFIPFLAAGALVAIYALLLRAGFNLNQSNTLRRLRLCERTVTLWWWVSAAVCLFLLWAVQAGVALLLSAWYVAAANPAFVNPQTIFLAFYQVPFLHGLVPLAEVSLWVRNLLLLATLALCAARVPTLLRQGRKPVAPVVLLAVTLVTFSAEMGGTNAVALLCSAIAITLFAQFWALFAEEELE